MKALQTKANSLLISIQKLDVETRIKLLMWILGEVEVSLQAAKEERP